MINRKLYKQMLNEAKFTEFAASKTDRFTTMTVLFQPNAQNICENIQLERELMPMLCVRAFC